MKNIEIVANFEREINKLDDVIGKPAIDDSLFWLNQGVHKFIKLRFNGDFVHHTGVEETEKRRSDLINLFVTEDLTPVSTDDANPSYNSYEYEYPQTFMFVLNEDVIISDNDGGHKMNTCVFECTRDSFMYRVNNSLTDFHYKNHRARPLRVRNSNGCSLLTDKNYQIEKYTLGYIRKPAEIVLGDQYDQEYPDFQDTTMYEIIKMAAQMYLENQSEERYKSLTQEVLTQE